MGKVINAAARIQARREEVEQARKEAAAQPEIARRQKLKLAFKRSIDLADVPDDAA